VSEPKPWAFVAGDGATVEVTQEHLEEARRLIDEGWHQVSRAYRGVARLPEGMTGTEALIDAERRSDHPHPNLETWATRMGEAHAGEHYLRCYAGRDGHSRDLDIPTFAAFRKLGGGTYLQWAYDKGLGKTG
jgi:hypothetical protein